MRNMSRDPGLASFIEVRLVRGVVYGMLLGLLAANSSVRADHWLTDPGEAAQAAVGGNKDILILFTGSDWCPPCKRLEAEVLSSEQFVPEFGRDFVLVKLDFLRNSPLPPRQDQINNTWAQQFGIAGFPTIVLVDQNMRPFGFVGFIDGGFDPFWAEVESLRQKRIRRDAAFEAAAKETGIERARLLDKGISELAENVVQVYYEDIVEEIVELDSEDELGLRTKWNAAKDAEFRRIVMTDILTLSRLEKPQRVVAFIDEVLNEVDFPPEQRLDILLIKLSMLQRAGDVPAAIALLDDMGGMDGVTPISKERLISRKAMLVAGAEGLPAALALIDSHLSANNRQLHLALTKVQLLVRMDRHQEALGEADRVLSLARFNPDLL
ncbi:MAG TPA: thioredoxin family protein, partial [Pirellulaceae bacterium]|nr:thioredoxin family protein [Pirellulaceae bacterium]